MDHMKVLKISTLRITAGSSRKINYWFNYFIIIILIDL
jgi:hypothetical protein